MEYIFNTTTTMKPYNNKSWWIDNNIVPRLRIAAGDVDEAIKKYKNIVNNTYYIGISNNAIKNKAAMYMDTEDGTSRQVGYIITGKTECENHNRKWVSQYIDLLIEILTVVDTKF